MFWGDRDTVRISLQHREIINTKFFNWKKNITPNRTWHWYLFIFNLYNNTETHINLKLLYQIINSLRTTDKGFYTKQVIYLWFLQGDAHCQRKHIKFWSQYLQPEKKISFQGLKGRNSTYKSDITLKLRSFMFCLHRHVSLNQYNCFISLVRT